MQPSRRPKDGRYGENPNRLQHYYQFQVILKPSPADIQELYLKSLDAIGIDPKLHDIRFVEDDWESPTLGAWGLGWECWCDGMEVSQFTYFQQVAGFECAPVSGELTYGLERLAMYVQGVDRVYDLNFNGRDGDKKVTYGDVFLQAEQEYSRHNFEFADTDDAVRAVQDGGGGLQEISRRRLDARQATAAAPDGAAGLRPVHQGEPRLQPARRARRDLGDRAAELHSARARAGEGLRRGVARDRSRRQAGMSANAADRRTATTDPRRRRGRQELLVVRLRALQDAAVLRRLARRHRIAPLDRSRGIGRSGFCTCKRTSNAAALRRRHESRRSILALLRCCATRRARAAVSSAARPTWRSIASRAIRARSANGGLPSAWRDFARAQIDMRARAAYFSPKSMVSAACRSSMHVRRHAHRRTLAAVASPDIARQCTNCDGGRSIRARPQTAHAAAMARDVRFHAQSRLSRGVCGAPARVAARSTSTMHRWTWHRGCADRTPGG